MVNNRAISVTGETRGTKLPLPFASFCLTSTVRVRKPARNGIPGLKHLAQRRDVAEMFYHRLVFEALVYALLLHKSTKRAIVVIAAMAIVIPQNLFAEIIDYHPVNRTK
jgi:hypothetical protein